MNQGEKIRMFRTSKGISQEYMAEKLSITQPAYANIESSKTKLSVDRLKEIAKILQVNVEEIVNFDDRISIQNVSNAQIGTGTYNHNVENKLLINSLEKEITFLKEEISYYKIQLSKKDDLIKTLINKK